MTALPPLHHERDDFSASCLDHLAQRSQQPDTLVIIRCGYMTLSMPQQLLECALTPCALRVLEYTVQSRNGSYPSRVMWDLLRNRTTELLGSMYGVES